jgi:ATP-dependent RNA helicase DDX55/SPB4
VKQKGAAALQKTPITLNNYYKIVDPSEKFHHLLTLLRNHKNQKHLVFMSTCACVQYFSKLLKIFLKNTEVLSLHRKLKDKRNKVFNEFKKLSR